MLRRVYTGLGDRRAQEMRLFPGHLVAAAMEFSGTYDVGQPMSALTNAGGKLASVLSV